MTDRCSSCRWIDVTKIGDRERQWIVATHCADHQPPPSPIELARRELDAIDRATGLAQLPGWRPLTGPGSIAIPPMEYSWGGRPTTSRGPQ